MNNHTFTIEQANYHHVILEGTHYEIGKQLAKNIASIPGWEQYITSHNLDLMKTGFNDFTKLFNYCENCCPGITEEIEGFADFFNIAAKDVPFWNCTFYKTSANSNCSQLAVTSSLSNDKHTYVGRSYEWNHKQDDLRLVTTRVKGKAAHVGFSALNFGRFDGINEHGLVVSMTGGGVFDVPLKNTGPMIWVLIRALLDNCLCVNDALKLIKKTPVAGFFSLLLVDKNNDVAIIEFADGTISINQASEKNSNSDIFSVNHFRFPDMEHNNRLNCGILPHSKIRENLITSWFSAKNHNIHKEDIKKLLSTPHPEGLCNYFYNDTFGTLWSIIFDATTLSVEVCFGAPTHNQWYTFTLNDKQGINKYSASIPICAWY